MLTLLGVVLLGGALVTPVGAQDTPVDDPAQVCVDIDLDGTRLLAKENGVPRTRDIAVDIPAGTISIPEARSFDTYEGRALTPPQTSERWELEFVGADGSIVGVSDVTPDLEDGVEFAEWVGSLGSVVLTAPAVAVRAHHRIDLPADGSPDSVNSSDITVCWAAQAACPLNPDGTPVDPSDPDCPQPACPLNPDGTPVDPADPDCPQPACPLNPDGTPVDPADPDCPQPTPPTTQPACPLNDDGSPVDPENPACPPPAGPEADPCPLNEDGAPVDPSDPDCPSTTTTAAPTPTTAPPPAPPTLPVTGSSTMAFVLIGAWLLAAGAVTMAFVRNTRATI